MELPRPQDLKFDTRADKHRILDAYGNPITMDAFGQLRISSPQTIFDSKQTYNNGDGLTMAQATSGSGIIDAHNADRACTTLNVDTATGSAIRQTRRRFNYQPGKSQLIFQTFADAGTVDGVEKKIGLFDESNGIFLKTDGNGASFVIRSSVTGSPVDTEVRQADWNVDNFTGRETSKKADFSKAQILVIDFEWLGVGQVRVGFVVDGQIRVAHIFQHANLIDGVYMSTPNLPMRWEVSSAGTTAGASLECICGSISSEGGTDPTGITTQIDSDIIAGIGTTFRPLIQVRLKSSALGATVKALHATVGINSNNDAFWAMLYNPTFSAPAGSWVSAGSHSAVEYNITETGDVTGFTHRMEGDLLISSGAGGSASGQVKAIPSDQSIALGSDVSGTSDVIALCAKVNTGTGDLVGSMTWQEFY